MPPRAERPAAAGDDEGSFMLAAVDRLVPLLDGEWSIAAFLSNAFSDEVTRVGAAGPQRESFPETISIGETESRWVDATTFCVALTGHAPVPLGFVLARADAPLRPRDKAEAEVALTAAGQLLASALLNIRHDAEDRLRARLQRAQDAAP